MSPLQGYTCSSDADPYGACAFNAHDCHPLAQCVINHDQKDGYECECNPGYYGNGENIANIINKNIFKYSRQKFILLKNIFEYD